MRGCRNIPALEMTRFEMERGKLVRTIFFSGLYTFGVHAAEAEVNIETGEVRLLTYASGHDVGQAINPQHVEGQF